LIPPVGCTDASNVTPLPTICPTITLYLFGTIEYDAELPAANILFFCFNDEEDVTGVDDGGDAGVLLTANG